MQDTDQKKNIGKEEANNLGTFQASHRMAFIIHMQL